MTNKKEFNNRIEYLNELGQLHRRDGPALEYSDGNRFWYLDGKLHRENGPAVEYSDGTHYWFLNGKLHRENGPAVDVSDMDDGTREWYINGKKLTESEFKLLRFVI